VSGLRVVLRCHPRNVPNNPFLRAFLSSVISLILELDTPIDGFIYVSSEPLRNALRHRRLLVRETASRPRFFAFALL
jgi:hypothetical protein